MVVLVLIKVVWVVWGCWSIGSQQKEKNDILQRKNWLVDKIVVEPRQLLKGCREDWDCNFKANGHCIPALCFQRLFLTFQFFIPKPNRSQ